MAYDALVKRATLFAVLSSILLIVLKVIAWWLTGAITLLASLIDSSFDFVASCTNCILVRYSLMPADRGHSFGHGKAEPLAALVQSAFIAGSAVFLLLSSIRNLIDPAALNFPLFGVIVTIISLLVTVMVVNYQYYVIRRTDSEAIKADMLHYKSDMLINGVVLVGLILSGLDFSHADGVVAFLIALYILYGAGKIGCTAIHSLLDRALPDNEVREIEKIVRSVTNIKGVHDIRTRQSGKTRFIQLHLELPDDMPLIEAHTISDQVIVELNHAFPNSDITIHQDPVSIVAMELAQGHEMPAMEPK